MKKTDQTEEKEKLRVPEAVGRRLPRYYRFLRTLLEQDVMRISSGELSALMGVTASQIRQDLNCFGAFGQQGYGYNVKMLYSRIGDILGLRDQFSALIVGEAPIADTVSNEPLFKRSGIALRGVLPPDAEAVKAFLDRQAVDIAVLTFSPAGEETLWLDLLFERGIRGILNVSGRELTDARMRIVNVNISDSIMFLCYQLNESEKA
ncbi:MAG: redox-sensing transcriptional repressor Rex [Ruminococcaceae bacterium]|nr:redox-sensing transcriptional repressor Rex [Oscillospiraceae bacterium]